jgi:hypothetical protein
MLPQPWMVNRQFRDLEDLVRVGIELILKARLGEVGIDDALDGLWEVLVNIDYEVRRLRYEESSAIKPSST